MCSSLSFAALCGTTRDKVYTCPLDNDTTFRTYFYFCLACRMGAYAINGGLKGSERLEVLSQAMATFSEPFVEQAGIKPHWHCLDLGCGGGQVTSQIAQQLGTEGSVLGIDLDPDNLRHASELAQRLSLSQASFKQMDVHHLDEQDQYDLVYTRFLLSHLPTAADLLKKVWEALKPHGQLLIEDTHFSGHFCHPPSTAFDEYVSLYQQLLQKRSADADIGPRLPQLLKGTGFKDIDLKVVQPVHHTGQSKLMAEITLAGISTALVEEGITSPEIIDLLMKELRALRTDQDSLISMPRIFQVSAVKG